MAEPANCKGQEHREILAPRDRILSRDRDRSSRLTGSEPGPLDKPLESAIRASLYQSSLGFARRSRSAGYPTYLPAGAADDITTPEQVLGAAKYLGTPAERIVQETVPGGHIGLFMGARTLKEHWPRIARWIAAQ